MPAELDKALARILSRVNAGAEEECCDFAGFFLFTANLSVPRTNSAVLASFPSGLADSRTL